MAAPLGHARYGGRKKGTPNRSTLSVKAALVEAFEELGGVKSLVRWARENEGDFYRLWIKVLPTDINLNDTSGEELSEDVRARLDAVDFSKRRLALKVGGVDVSNVGDPASPGDDRRASSGDGGGEIGPS